VRRGTAILVLLHAAAPALAQVCTVERISVDAAGVEGNAPSTGPVVTPDGRFVAFSSAASNLVAGDGNGVADVFVRDLALGTIERVSVAPGGVEANAACSAPAISDDGRYVAFQSAATTLTAGDVNGAIDVFLVDRVTGVVERVSNGLGGAPADGPSFGATLCGGARFVLFVSWASNLVAADLNATRDVFLKDRQTGATERISVSSAGLDGNDMAGSSAVLSFASPDGRFVVFGSSASNLVPGDGNGAMDVFLRDRVLGTTTLAITAPGGGAPGGWTELGGVTRDLRRIGFSSSADDLVPGDTNGATDAFVLDRATGGIERVSVATGGVQSSADSWPPTPSIDGRFAVFTSTAADLVPFDTNDRRDVFRRDLVAGTTERAVYSWSGLQLLSDVPSVSIDALANTFAFAYLGNDVVHSDANDVGDIVVSACPVGTAFCSGDGSATACPCGPGALGAGCPNSHSSGGVLTAAGGAHTLNDTLTLVASNLPPNTLCIFLQGSTQLSGGQGAPFGDGLRCIGGTILRFGTRPTTAGVATWGFGVPGAQPVSVQGNVPLGGDVRYYQAWYRNSAAFCTILTYNLTNGFEVSWTP
jgi:Tol biopolymer transport system component